MKKMGVIFLILAAMTIVLFQNCAKPVTFSTPSSAVVSSSGYVGDNGNTGAFGETGNNG